MTGNHKQRQSGISLVELMVALGIGLLLLAFIVQIFVNSKTAYRAQDTLSRMQEAGRFTADLLMRDVRQAGFKGCMNNATINNIVTPADSWNKFGNPIEGYASASIPTGFGVTNNDVLANTDVFRVQYAGPTGVRISETLEPTTAQLKIVGNPYAFKANEILIITNCGRADVFRATTVSSSTTNPTIAHGIGPTTGGNSSTMLSYAYAKLDSEVTRFVTNIYYITKNPTTGKTSLYRRRLGLYNNGDSSKWCTNNATSVTYGLCQEEVAENVENMHVYYGLDLDGDQAADKFLATGSMSSSDWAKVVSVRVHLLIATGDNAATKPINYTFDGTSYTATDRKIRREIANTISLRNLSP